MFTLKLVLFGLVGFIPIADRELWSVLPNTAFLEDPVGCFIARHSMVGVVVKGTCREGCKGANFEVPTGSRLVLPEGSPALKLDPSFWHVTRLESLTSNPDHRTVRDGCRVDPWGCHTNGILMAKTGKVDSCHFGEHYDDYYVDAVQFVQQMSGGTLTLDFLVQGTTGTQGRLVVEPKDGEIRLVLGSIPLLADQIYAAARNSSRAACGQIHHMQHFGALYRLSKDRPSEIVLRQVALPHLHDKPDALDCKAEVDALVQYWGIAAVKPEEPRAFPISSEVCGSAVFNRVP